MTPTQLRLLESRPVPRAEYPAPEGWAPYSCMVVWRTCLAWELHDWLVQRKGAA